MRAWLALVSLVSLVDFVDFVDFVRGSDSRRLLHDEDEEELAAADLGALDDEGAAFA